MNRIVVENYNLINGFDNLIKLNVSLEGVEGSCKYKIELRKFRKLYLNKLFSKLKGIHNKTSKENLKAIKFITPCDVVVDFHFLMSELRQNRQYDLATKIENVYLKLSKNEYSDNIYNIIHFLLKLEQTNKVIKSDFFHLEPVTVSNHLIYHGDTNSLIPDDDLKCLFMLTPRDLFVDKSFIKDIPTDTKIMIEDTDSEYFPKITSFQFDGNDMATTSGYFTESVDETFVNTTLTDNTMESRTQRENKPDLKLNEQILEKSKQTSDTVNKMVNYPFSELSNLPSDLSSDQLCPVSSRVWYDEFYEECMALEQNKSISRHFVWEERGKNVGVEKPRLIEWRGPTSELKLVSSLTLCRAVEHFRSTTSRLPLTTESSSSSAAVDRYLNTNSTTDAEIWIEDLLLLRQGYSSESFVFQQDCNQFCLAREPPSHMRAILLEHCRIGTIYARLSLLAKQQSLPPNITSSSTLNPIDTLFSCKQHYSAISQRIFHRLQHLLHMQQQIYSQLMNKVHCQPAEQQQHHHHQNSLLQFTEQLQLISQQTILLGQVFDVDPITAVNWSMDLYPFHSESAIFLGGADLLNHLYNACVNSHCLNNQHESSLVYLLRGGIQVVLEQLEQWIYHGNSQILDDSNPTSDLVIVEDDCPTRTNRKSCWWFNIFNLQNWEKCENWLFDKDDVTNIIRCGKSVRLLTEIQLKNPSIQLAFNHTKLRKAKINFSKKTNFGVGVKSILDNYRKIYEQVNEELIKKELEKLKLQAQAELDARLLKISIDQEQITQRDQQISMKYRQKKQQQHELYDQLSLAAKTSREDKQNQMLQERQEDLNRLNQMIESGALAVGTTYNSALRQQLIHQVKEELLDEYAKKIVDAEIRMERNLERIGLRQNQLMNANNFYKSQVIKEIEKSGNFPMDYQSNNNALPLVQSNVNDSTIQYTDESNDVFTEQLSDFFQKDKVSNKAVIDPTAIEQSQRRIYYGNPSDSSVQQDLYPDNANFIKSKILPSKNTLKLHSSDSNIQRDMYPDNESTNTNQTNSQTYSNQLKLHSSDSTVQDQLYPKKSNSQVTVKNYEYRSRYGNPSDSEAQYCLYPDKYQKDRANDNITYEEVNKLAGQITDIKEIEQYYPTINWADEFKVIEEVKSNEDEDDDEEEIELCYDGVMKIIDVELSILDENLMSCLINQCGLTNQLNEMHKSIFLDDAHSWLSDIFVWLSSNSDSQRLSCHAFYDNSGRLRVNYRPDACLERAISVHYLSGKVKDGSKQSDQWILRQLLLRDNAQINNNNYAKYMSLCTAFIQIKYANWCVYQARKLANSRCTKLNLCLVELQHWTTNLESCLVNIDRNYTHATSTSHWNIDRFIEQHNNWINTTLWNCVSVCIDQFGEQYTQHINVYMVRARQQIQKTIQAILLLCHNVLQQLKLLPTLTNEATITAAHNHLAQDIQGQLKSRTVFLIGILHKINATANYSTTTTATPAASVLQQNPTNQIYGFTSHTDYLQQLLTTLDFNDYYAPKYAQL